MSDHIRVHLSVRETYLGLTNHPGPLSLASLRGHYIEYSFDWGKGGKVTAAGWQVTLCDPIWYVISHSGVMISITICYYPTYFTLLYLLKVCEHSIL